MLTLKKKTILFTLYGAPHLPWEIVNVELDFQLLSLKKSDLFEHLREKDIFIQTSETGIGENHCNEQETCS